MANRELCQIALDIRANWPNISPAALPYLNAMNTLDSLADRYGAEDAESIVLYFLNNASSWRGPEAKRIKAELKQMLKEFNCGR